MLLHAIGLLPFLEMSDQVARPMTASNAQQPRRTAPRMRFRRPKAKAVPWRSRTPDAPVPVALPTLALGSSRS